MQYTMEELMCLLDTIHMKLPDLMYKVICGCYSVRLPGSPASASTCVASANLQWNICQNRIENHTSYLVMVIGSACLLIPRLNT